MRGSLLVSATLHAALVALAWFGLPYLQPEPPELDEVIFVQLSDLAEVTNLPPEPREAAPEPAPARPAPPPPKPEPPPPPKPEPPAPAPEPEPPAPAPEPEPPAPVPEPPAHEAPAQEPPAPLPATRVRPQPPQVPAATAAREHPQLATPRPRLRPKSVAPTRPKPRERSFENVLTDLKRPKTPPSTQEGSSLADVLDRTTRLGSDPDFDPAKRITQSEISRVRQQIAACWNIGVAGAGAENAEILAVEVSILMNPDRTVRDARVVDETRMAGDTAFRIAAERALRAIRHPDCRVLELPDDKYEVWKAFTFNFDPRRLMQ